MKINKNIAISETGFLFNPSSGESFSVNPIGTEIINMLKQNKSKEEIKKKILSDYTTDEATFEKDFADFTGMLKQYSLSDNNGKKES